MAVARVRQERLEEAIDVIRLLFSGETCSHRGEYFELDRARIFDLPDEPPPIVVAAGGPRAARIAGEKADGLIATEPSHEITSAYRDAGGEGPRCAEIGVCWESRRGARYDAPLRALDAARLERASRAGDAARVRCRFAEREAPNLARSRTAPTSRPTSTRSTPISRRASTS